MGDHFVLLVDRLLTESTLEAALESRNRSQGEPAATLMDVSSTGKLVECRICQDEDDDSKMETPCSCCGSLKVNETKALQKQADAFPHHVHSVSISMPSSPLGVKCALVNTMCISPPWFHVPNVEAVRINFFRGFRLSLAWWAYTFPMTGAAIATIKYANEVKHPVTQTMTVLFSAISTLTVTTLLVSTVYHAFVLRNLFPNDIAIAISQYAHRRCVQRWCNEKGDTICEICHQPFKPGYTAPPPLFHYGGIPMNFRGNWEIPRRELYNPRFIAMVSTDRSFLDADYDGYSSPTSRSLICCRTVAIIFMVLLVLRHALPIIISGTDDYSFTLFAVLLLRICGVLLPIYLTIKAVTAILRRRRQHEPRDMSYNTSGEDDQTHLQPQQHLIHVH